MASGFGELNEQEIESVPAASLADDQSDADYEYRGVEQSGSSSGS